MSDARPLTSEEKKNRSAGFHIFAWIGIPVYYGLIIMAAISAVGAPGANHDAQFWNSMLLWVPVAGATVAIVAISRSVTWLGRISAGIPLLGYLAAAGYMISWKLNH